MTASGRYRAYEPIVAEAAAETGLAADRAAALLQSWSSLRPYPDSLPALRELERAGVALVVVTNTSRALAESAAASLPVRWTAVVSAEASGWYKPAPEAYRAGVEAGARPAAEVLFVAGSAHDVSGASAAGLDVFWANRRGLPLPPGTRPLAVARTLEDLPGLILS